MSAGHVTIRAVVLCALTAAPAQAAEKSRVMVLNLAHSDASLELLSRTLTEQVLTELTRTQRIEAVGPSDLAAVLGLQRQKELVGCTDESSTCLAEISAALGAPWLVSGSLARLGSAIRIDLKLIRTSDGKAVYRDGRSTDREAQVFDLLASMVKAMVGSAFPGEAPPAGSAGAGAGPWLTLGAGVVVLGAGAVISGMAGAQWQNLHDPTWTAKTSWVEVRSTGDAFNTGIIVGPVLLGVGVLAATGGLLWRLLLRTEPSVSLMLTGNGFALGGLF